jgi:hypothetical protein
MTHPVTRSFRHHRSLPALALLLTAGCGGGGPSISTSGYDLATRDQLYYVRPTGYFCDGLGASQVQVRLLDYFPACPSDRKSGDPDPYDQKSEHVRLNLTLSLGGNPKYVTTPFTFDAQTTCTGGGASAYAELLHFAPGPSTAAPDRVLRAERGSIKVDSYDPTGAKPLVGRYELVFGGQTFTGSLNAFSCSE